MHVRITNREYPDHTAVMKQSDLGLHCFSIPFMYPKSVRNFRTLTVMAIISHIMEYIALASLED